MELKVNSKNINFIHLWLSLIVFAGCLLQPAFYSEIPQSSQILLLIGWLGPLDGHFSWYANVFYIISLSKHKKVESSIIYGLTALFLALSFLAYDSLDPGFDSPTKIIGYGLGYYLWVLAIFIYCTGQMVLNKNKTDIKNMKFETIPLHDAVLENITYDWQSKTIQLTGKLCEKSPSTFILRFEGVSSLNTPHQEGWGPSTSINDLASVNNTFYINMQTGDTITVKAMEFIYARKDI